MDMERIINGDLKVGYEQEPFGRRRNDALPAYLDLTTEAANAVPARVPLPPKSGAPSRRRTHADGELDVFSAERYFKGATDDDNEEGSASAAPVETVASPAIPMSKPAWTCASAASAGSGASSNSQTAFLPDARRRPGNKCCLQVSELLRPCSGKSAVRINDGRGEAKEAAAQSSKTAASRIQWYRDLRMEKANLELAGECNRGVVASGALQPNLTAKVAAIGRDEKAAEYASASFSRGSFTLQAPAKVSVGGGGGRDGDNDSGSESSSDLFEIKSLVIDDCPYEPSEASIQWSVVTASAVDMSAPSERGGGRGRGPVTMTQNRERPVGLLAGCVSRRAVNVSAITAVRRFPDSPVPQRIDG